MIDELRSVVGPSHVLTDPAVTESYAVDWTRRFRGTTHAVVRPGSTEEVADVVRVCARHGAAVVPQGGNTGLVGGGVPLAGEIVLSLRRLDTIDPASVDPVAGQLTAGAGTTISDVHAAARRAGWEYGVDWAARDTATIGGSIATNAGGERVLRYGSTRAQLLGIEAVLANGSIVSHLSGLVKDNTGYHLPSLVCGSEGTLAVVTAARLRLVPRLEEHVVAMLGFTKVDTALEACASLRQSLPSLEAGELFFADGVGLVCEQLALPPPPVVAEVYLLVECADHEDPAPALGKAVDGVDVTDAAVAVDPAQRAALWRYREDHTEAINAVGPPHKLDVSLPQPQLASFCTDVRAAVASVAPSARVWLFGHAADNNLHVNVTGVEPDDDRIDDAVLQLVVDRGGSISAEHGIGTEKKRWLPRNESAADLDAMRAIKHALDPQGILNPNVLFA